MSVSNTIAVTGATGRLGRAVLQRLAGAGRPAVAIARDPSRVAGVADVRTGDYGDQASLRRAFAGIDTLLLISAPVKDGTDRIALHRNAIQAARAAGVRRMLFTSVIGGGAERDTWFWPTQRVNRTTEDDLRGSGLEWIIARNGLYLDLDVVQLRNAIATGVYSNAGATGRTGYITIDELAVALVALVTGEHGNGHTLNLVGAPHTQVEIVAAFNAAFDAAVRYEPISDEQSVAKFLKIMPHRGEAVARMLTGAFQCIRNGAYDVPSHFEQAAGRPAKTLAQMMADLKALADAD